MLSKNKSNVVIRLPSLIGKGVCASFRDENIQPYGIIELMSVDDATDAILQKAMVNETIKITILMEKNLCKKCTTINIIWKIMNDRKLLAVYNTCGIQSNNTDWYIESIDSLLKQDIQGLRVALSSCKNSPECIKKLFSTFGNKISYCLTPELHTVNITFNNTVQRCVDHYGEFETYMYIDSGCTMDEQTDIFSLAHKTMTDSDYGIVVVQTDTDECLENLGPPYVYETNNIQVTGII